MDLLKEKTTKSSMRTDPQEDKICNKSTEWTDPLEDRESKSSMRTDPQEDKICDKSTEWTDPTRVK